jgi:hypothetical protein
MKNLSFILLIFTFTASINAQEEGFYGLQATYSYTGGTYYPAAGVSMEAWFGKHFSVNFSAIYGPIDSDTYYFATGGGQALGVYLIKKGFENTNDLAYALPLGIMSFVIPESLAYRIPIARSLQLGLYLSPFGYEVIRNTTEELSMERTSYELGMRFYLRANHWIHVVPRIGMKGYYGDRDLGVNYGLSLMFRGKKKDEKN